MVYTAATVVGARSDDAASAGMLNKAAPVPAAGPAVRRGARVETLITTRIDTLEPGDRFLLRNASVLGARFELDLLADVLADELADVGDLDRWRRLGEFVAWEGTNELRFRHDLFRTVAYEGLSFRRRREIHGRVGTALEQRAGEDAAELAPLLSLHFLHAEDYERAWRYSAAVGALAKRRSANVDAAELFHRALVAAEHLELPPSEVEDVAEALGDVCELTARYEEAGEAYRLARELTDDGLVRSRLMRKEGILRERLGSYPEALEWYGRGLDALDAAARDDGLASRVQLELATAGVKFRQGHFDEAVDWSARAAEHAELADDRAALGHAYYLLHLNHMSLGEKDEEHARLALSMLEEAGDLVLQSNLVNNLGIEAYYAGRWDEASELFRRSGELSGRAGDVVNVARAQNNEGEIVSDQGKLEEAEALFVEARRVWRAARYPLGIALATSNLGRRVAARARRFDEALELFSEALEAFESLGSEALAHETQARRAECLVLAGRFQEALDVAPTVLEAAEDNPLLYPLLERLHGYALVQARRADEAGARFERSLELARELEADYELALTLEALARTGLGGQEAEAESQAILERLGVVSTPRVPLP